MCGVDAGVHATVFRGLRPVFQFPCSSLRTVGQRCVATRLWTNCPMVSSPPCPPLLGCQCACRPARLPADAALGAHCERSSSCSKGCSWGTAVYNPEGSDCWVLLCSSKCQALRCSRLFFLGSSQCHSVSLAAAVVPGPGWPAGALCSCWLSCSEGSLSWHALPSCGCRPPGHSDAALTPGAAGLLD